MSIDIAKDSVCINQMIGKKENTIIVEGDIIVPDIKPDVLNVIHANGIVCMYKKEVLDGKVRLDGSIDVYINYIADGQDIGIRAINSCIDFTEMIDFENAKIGMSLENIVEIKSIECKVLNGRKLNVKASLGIKTKVYSDDEIEFIKEITNAEEVQVRKEEFKINSLVGKGNTKIYAKDTIMIDNIDNLAEILKVELNIQNKDVKVSYNKILAKSDLEVKILYLTEDNRINIVNTKIPAMGFVDIQNVSDDNICDCLYEIKNVIIKPESVEEHSIYVEAELELSCFVYQNKQVDILQDLYSPYVDLKFEPKKIEAILGKERITDLCHIRQSESIPEIHGNRIYDVEVVAEIISQTIMKDKIMYEGEANLSFIFEAQNTEKLSTKQVKVPITFTMNAQGVNQGNNIETEINIGAQNFVVMPDGSIDIGLDLEFNVTISKTAKLNIIEEVTEEENRNTNLCSLVIYFVKPGDTLWEIAKKFRSTVDDIARLNNIENPDKLNVGQKLFIPKYVKRTISRPA